MVANFMDDDSSVSDHRAAWNAAVGAVGSSPKHSSTARKNRDPSTNKNGDLRHRKALRLLREGEDGRALEALSQVELAPMDDGTLTKLQELHPPAVASTAGHVTVAPSEEFSYQEVKPPLQLTTKEVMRGLSPRAQHRRQAPHQLVLEI